jgi:hypothetical protein
LARRAATVALVAFLLIGTPDLRASVDGSTSAPSETDERRSSSLPLNLAGRADLLPVRFDLEPGRASDAGLPPAGFGRMVLEVGPPPDPVPGLDLGPLEHPPDWIVPGDREQWPSPDTLLQRHLAAEIDRIVSGQPWGRAPVALMFDAVEIVDAVGRLIRRWRDSRLPPGAHIPTKGAAVLRVTESDGPPPATISVVPLAEDWVGETVHGVCDAVGRCVVGDLPDAPSVLLVIGHGGAVVAHPGGNEPLDVTLRPLGRLRLEPQRPDVAVRLVVAGSEVAVPVVRWLNAGRGEWIEIDGDGVLYLPEGQYVVEARAGAARRTTRVTVQADRTTVVRVP